MAYGPTHGSAFSFVVYERVDFVLLTILGEIKVLSGVKHKFLFPTLLLLLVAVKTKTDSVRDVHIQ
jgi:hypothetical protein